MAQENPGYAVAIVGREREVADVTELVERSRLVTIAGPGGIGKSRLAAEVAAAVHERPRRRVAFVDLSPVSDARLIPDAIARAAGVEFDPPDDPIEALAIVLRMSRLLVVLDNCERLVSACAAVAETIARECPDVRFLATSREPLGVGGEAVYRLGPLDERASITLFAEHAARVDPSFSPSESDLAALRSICKRLDGIALAIVLAASYVSSFTLGQLRSRLEGHFKGHKAVEALIAWSYDSLPVRERKVFRHLAVFTDSFTSEAAIAVAGDETLEALEILVEKSMVERNGDRYRMLEPIRVYGLERLQAEGEEGATRRAFAEYFARRAQTAEGRFGYGTQEEWIELLAPDLEHLRAALDWTRDFDPDLGSQLVANLLDFWELYNVAAEGLRRSEAMLAMTPDPSGPNALPIFLAVARLSMIAHVYFRSFESYERALALAIRFDDRRALAEARRIGARARRILEIHPERCLDDLRAALEVIREEGNPYRIARTLTDYGFELIDTGNEAEGWKVLREAERLTTALGWPHLSAHLQINLAELQFRTGERAAAAKRGRDLVELLRPRGSTAMIVLALTNLSAYLAVLGEDAEAYETAREAVDLAIVRDMRYCVTWALQSVAVVIAHHGNLRGAAQLLGYTDQYLEFTGSRREPTELAVEERVLSQLRNGDISIEAERGAGRALTEEEAIALAFPSVR